MLYCTLFLLQSFNIFTFSSHVQCPLYLPPKLSPTSQHPNTRTPSRPLGAKWALSARADSISLPGLGGLFLACPNAAAFPALSLSSTFSGSCDTHSVRRADKAGPGNKTKAGGAAGTGGLIAHSPGGNLQTALTTNPPPTISPDNLFPSFPPSLFSSGENAAPCSQQSAKAMPVKSPQLICGLSTGACSWHCLSSASDHLQQQSPRAENTPFQSRNSKNGRAFIKD